MPMQAGLGVRCRGLFRLGVGFWSTITIANTMKMKWIIYAGKIIWRCGNTVNTIRLLEGGEGRREHFIWR